MAATIYTSAGCPYCILAKKSLDAAGDPCVEIDVDSAPGARETLKELTGGEVVVPVLVEEDGEVRVGFGGVCGGRRGLRRWLWHGERKRGRV